MKLTAPPTVLVLASGCGERFIASGGRGSKLEAMLCGKTVLEHTLCAVRGSGLPFHVEAQAHPGMGDSIAAAVRATMDAQGWLVLPGDMPLIQSSSILAAAQALTQHSVAAAHFRGQRGHPVGFARACRGSLLALSGDKGALAVLRTYALHKVALEDRGVVLDIDTLADLSHAESLMRPLA